VAIAVTGEIVHLELGRRFAYGSPYPLGFAVGHINQTGDASGGDLTFTFNADGGFLYRFEGFQLTVGQGVLIGDTHAITNHAWATEKSGLGTSAFSLNHIMQGTGMSTFAVYTIVGPGDGESGGYDASRMLRRLPMGSTRNVSLQVIFQASIDNTNTVTHEASLWLSYWRKEALYLPGFMSAFMEAPEVPPVTSQVPRLPLNFRSSLGVR